MSTTQTSTTSDEITDSVITTSSIANLEITTPEPTTPEPTTPGSNATSTEEITTIPETTPVPETTSETTSSVLPPTTTIIVVTTDSGGLSTTTIAMPTPDTTPSYNSTISPDTSTSPESTTVSNTTTATPEPVVSETTSTIIISSPSFTNDTTTESSTSATTSDALPAPAGCSTMYEPCSDCDAEQCYCEYSSFTKFGKRQNSYNCAPVDLCKCRLNNETGLYDCYGNGSSVDYCTPATTIPAINSTSTSEDLTTTITPITSTESICAGSFQACGVNTQGITIDGPECCPGYACDLTIVSCTPEKTSTPSTTSVTSSQSICAGSFQACGVASLGFTNSPDCCSGYACDLTVFSCDPVMTSTTDLPLVTSSTGATLAESTCASASQTCGVASLGWDEHPDCCSGYACDLTVFSCFPVMTSTPDAITISTELETTTTSTEAPILQTTCADPSQRCDTSFTIMDNATYTLTGCCGDLACNSGFCGPTSIVSTTSPLVMADTTSTVDTTSKSAFPNTTATAEITSEPVTSDATSTIDTTSEFLTTSSTAPVGNTTVDAVLAVTCADSSMPCGTDSGLIGTSLYNITACCDDQVCNSGMCSPAATSTAISTIGPYINSTTTSIPPPVSETTCAGISEFCDPSNTIIGTKTYFVTGCCSGYECNTKCRPIETTTTSAPITIITSSVNETTAATTEESTADPTITRGPYNITIEIPYKITTEVVVTITSGYTSTITTEYMVNTTVIESSADVTTPTTDEPMPYIDSTTTSLDMMTTCAGYLQSCSIDTTYILSNDYALTGCCGGYECDQTMMACTPMVTPAGETTSTTNSEITTTTSDDTLIAATVTPEANLITTCAVAYQACSIESTFFSNKDYALTGCCDGYECDQTVMACVNTIATPAGTTTDDPATTETTTPTETITADNTTTDIPISITTDLDLSAAITTSTLYDYGDTSSSATSIESTTTSVTSVDSSEDESTPPYADIVPTPIDESSLTTSDLDTTPTTIADPNEGTPTASITYDIDGTPTDESYLTTGVSTIEEIATVDALTTTVEESAVEATTSEMPTSEMTINGSETIGTSTSDASTISTDSETSETATSDTDSTSEINPNASESFESISPGATTDIGVTSNGESTTLQVTTSSVDPSETIVPQSSSDSETINETLVNVGGEMANTSESATSTSEETTNGTEFTETPSGIATSVPATAETTTTDPTPSEADTAESTQLGSFTTEVALSSETAAVSDPITLPEPVTAPVSSSNIEVMPSSDETAGSSDTISSAEMTSDGETMTDDSGSTTIPEATLTVAENIEILSEVIATLSTTVTGDQTAVVTTEAVTPETTINDPTSATVPETGATSGFDVTSSADATVTTDTETTATIGSESITSVSAISDEATTNETTALDFTVLSASTIEPVSSSDVTTAPEPITVSDSITASEFSEFTTFAVTTTIDVSDSGDEMLSSAISATSSNIETTSNEIPTPTPETCCGEKHCWVFEDYCVVDTCYCANSDGSGVCGDVNYCDFDAGCDASASLRCSGCRFPDETDEGCYCTADGVCLEAPCYNCVVTDNGQAMMCPQGDSCEPFPDDTPLPRRELSSSPFNRTHTPNIGSRRQHNQLRTTSQDDIATRRSSTYRSRSQFQGRISESTLSFNTSKKELKRKTELLDHNKVNAIIEHGSHSLRVRNIWGTMDRRDGIEVLPPGFEDPVPDAWNYLLWSEPLTIRRTSGSIVTTTVAATFTLDVFSDGSTSYPSLTSTPALATQSTVPACIPATFIRPIGLAKRDGQTILGAVPYVSRSSTTVTVGIRDNYLLMTSNLPTITQGLSTVAATAAAIKDSNVDGTVAAQNNGNSAGTKANGNAAATVAAQNNGNAAGAATNNGNTAGTKANGNAAGTAANNGNAVGTVAAQNNGGTAGTAVAQNDGNAAVTAANNGNAAGTAAAQNNGNVGGATTGKNNGNAAGTAANNGNAAGGTAAQNNGNAAATSKGQNNGNVAGTAAGQNNGNGAVNNNNNAGGSAGSATGGNNGNGGGTAANNGNPANNNNNKNDAGGTAGSATGGNNGNAAGTAGNNGNAANNAAAQNNGNVAGDAANNGNAVGAAAVQNNGNSIVAAEGVYAMTTQTMAIESIGADGRRTTQSVVVVRPAATGSNTGSLADLSGGSNSGSNSYSNAGSNYDGSNSGSNVGSDSGSYSGSGSGYDSGSDTGSSSGSNSNSGASGSDSGAGSSSGSGTTTTAHGVPGQTFGNTERVVNVPKFTIGTYFAAMYLPTIMAVIIKILFETIVASIKMMEPFERLHRTQGATAEDSLCSQYLSSSISSDVFTSIYHGRSIPLWTLLIYILITVAAPVSSSAMTVKPMDQCTENAAKYNCDPAWIVDIKFIRIVEGLLAACLLFTIFLVWDSWHYHAGVATNPTSIASIAVLLNYEPLRQDLQKIEPEATEEETSKALEEYHFWLIPHDPSRDENRYGIVHSPKRNFSVAELDIEPGFFERISSKFTSSFHNRYTATLPTFTPKQMRQISDGFHIFTSVSLLAILIAYLVDHKDDAFNRFFVKQDFMPKFLLMCLSSVIDMQWKNLEREVRIIDPYRRLAFGNARPENTILCALNGTCWSNMPGSLRRLLKFDHMWFETMIASCAILSDINIIAVSGVLWTVAQTESAYYWSNITSVTCMVIMTIALAITMIWWRCDPTVNAMPRMPETISVVLSYICTSRMAADFAAWGLENLNDPERDEFIVSKGRRYRFARLIGEDGLTRWCVDYDEGVVLHEAEEEREVEKDDRDSWVKKRMEGTVVVRGDG